MAVRVFTIAFVMLLGFVPAALAAFPGANGKIAFSAESASGSYDIYAVNPEGSGLVPLTSQPTHDFSPAWSPDGKRIAFVSDRDGNGEIYVMNADGSSQTRLTTTAAYDFAPAWSPDGRKIAFHGGGDGDFEIWVMSADGTGLSQLTNNSVADEAPSWSPDGGRIIFARGGSLHTMAADGSGQTQAVQCSGPPGCGLSEPDWSPDGTNRILYVRSYQPEDEDHVQELEWRPLGGGAGGNVSGPTPCCRFGHAWSPDGKRVVYEEGGLKIADPNGANIAPLPTGFDPEEPDWQPVVARGYPRPKSAGSYFASLVPSFAPCASPNRQHGPPLAEPSCAPPVQQSPRVSVGTPDANTSAANFSGAVVLDVIPGVPSTAADEADVLIRAVLSDVRCAPPSTTCGTANDSSSPPDYAGALAGAVSLRITDRNNAPFPDPVTAKGPGTVQDQTLTFTIPCAATTSTSRGSACSVDTTADALVAGTVIEQQRSNWELGDVRVLDGGADGDPGTADGAEVFLRQGVFVP